MALGFVALFRALGYFECDMGGMAASVAAVAAAATLIESLPINARRVALTHPWISRPKKTLSQQP